MKKSTFYLAWAISLVMTAAFMAEAQRPGIFSVLQTTTATFPDPSLLVGCAAGVSTGCTGTALAGHIRLSGTSPTADWYESSGASDSKYWRFLVSGNVMALQVLDDNYDTPANVLLLDRVAAGAGSFKVSTGFAFGTTQNITTTTGDQEITLGTTTGMLRITTGGSGSNDNIVGITGGYENRQLWICTISTPQGDIRLVGESGAATSPTNRLLLVTDPYPMVVKQCNHAVNDNTSARWRINE